MAGLAAVVAALSFIVAAPAPAVTGRVVDGRTGTPVARAEIMAVGQPGSVKTDDAGRFEWPIAPQLPIDVIVVLRDGRVARPIRVTSLEPSQELTLSIEATIS